MIALWMHKDWLGSVLSMESVRNAGDRRSSHRRAKHPITGLNMNSATQAWRSAACDMPASHPRLDIASTAALWRAADQWPGRLLEDLLPVRTAGAEGKIPKVSIAWAFRMTLSHRRLSKCVCVCPWIFWSFASIEDMHGPHARASRRCMCTGGRHWLLWSYTNGRGNMTGSEARCIPHWRALSTVCTRLRWSRQRHLWGQASLSCLQMSQQVWEAGLLRGLQSFSCILLFFPS